MVDLQSPIGKACEPGRHGNGAGKPPLRLAELTPGCLIQIAAFPGFEREARAAIKKAASLTVSGSPGSGQRREQGRAFNIGPGAYLVCTRSGTTAAKLAAALDRDKGTVTDLTHGRTLVSLSGSGCEWVLSKLFALDFSPDGFPVNHGVSTAHHDIFAAIHRTGAKSFEIYVYRSFARAFWLTLCAAATETGYEVLPPTKL